MKTEKTINQVPDGYFENLEKSVLMQVGLDTPHPSKKTPQIWYWTAAVAASLLLMLMWPLTKNTDEEYVVSELELAYVYAIDDYDLVEVLSEEELTELTTQFEAFTAQESEAAIEYLLQDVDEITMYEFL